MVDLFCFDTSTTTFHRMQHINMRQENDSPSCFSRYPGTCCVDQVGVKAPGRPTMIMFLPLAYSAMSMLSGSGKPWKSLAEGSLSPAATLRAVAERAFDTEGAKAVALPARAVARKSFMAMVFGLYPTASSNFGSKEWAGCWWSGGWWLVLVRWRHQRHRVAREASKMRQSCHVMYVTCDADLQTDDGLTYVSRSTLSRIPNRP